MFKTRFISMLALLMTAVTGAWAQEQSETIATAAGWVEGLIVEGTHFTISNNGNYADEDGMDATAGITVTAKNGETITKVVISCTYNPGSVNDGNTSVSSGTKEITNGGGTITVTGVNASTFTFTCSEVDPQFGQFVVYYTEATVAVTGVTLAPTSATLTLGGETLTLTATVAPNDATDKTVTWTTSDAAVATVANGVVTAVGAGTATITATATNGTADTSDDKTATCTVTVTVPVSGVTLSQTEAALNISETLTLTPTVLPAEATNKTVAWTTSDASVATVADGVVTAVAAGTATITVTTTDGAKTATCTVTVAEPTYSVALKEGTDDAANWQGKAGEGAYQALPLTGLEAGTAVSVKYNGTKKVKSVKAKKKAPANVPVESITLNKTATEIAVGQTETLSVTEVLPANATDPTYTWKTSDETKATVDQDGKVTAVAAGNVNIYAEANDGSGVSATCAVTVTLTYPIALSAVTADYIGSVITSDGNVYPAKTAVPDGCTAVGILGKVTETGHGLILALKNATSQTWNTINGWESVTAYAGTTLKVLPDDGARGVNLTSYTTLGATAVSNWAVAQKSDYEAIFNNLGSKAGDEDGTTYDGNVNAFITTGVGGTALSDYYWSATENGDDAWNFGSVYWNDNNKTSSYRVRPVLGF